MAHDNHDMYLTTALMSRINEHIVKAQELLVNLLKNRPDDTKSIEICEAVILELKSLLK